LTDLLSHKSLPHFSEYLHHHSVELNAVVYSLAGTRCYLDSYVDFACWKKMAKKMAHLSVLNERGTPPKPHDAADDAVLALLSWRWLRAIIAESNENITPIGALYKEAGNAQSSAEMNDKQVQGRPKYK
jgi:hypothetical protein